MRRRLTNDDALHCSLRLYYLTPLAPSIDDAFLLRLSASRRNFNARRLLDSATFESCLRDSLFVDATSSGVDFYLALYQLLLASTTLNVSSVALRGRHIWNPDD